MKAICICGWTGLVDPDPDIAHAQFHDHINSDDHHVGLLVRAELRAAGGQVHHVEFVGGAIDGQLQARGDLPARVCLQMAPDPADFDTPRCLHYARTCRRNGEGAHLYVMERQ